MLCLLGYVDYMDAFEQRHRFGYARQFVPNTRENNLVFITKPGYNYDRERKHGEGNDWDDKQQCQT